MSKPCILCLVVLVSSPCLLGQDESVDVYTSDLSESVAVRLLFLDVEVVDAKGEPIAGLTKDDFTVRVNNWSHPIHSVDDLCSCDGESKGRPRDSPSFVLFFDFSQLTPQGRGYALHEAERWVREVRHPADRALVAAYSTEAGLRRLCAMTDDGERLIAAIRSAGTDPELVDPFPARFGERLGRCTSGVLSCHNSGLREYWQTHQSSKVLLHFLARMDAFPGRKALLLFYQNNAVYPGRLYARDPSGNTFFDGKPTDTVPNLGVMLAEIAGTAMATGTVVYPITSGPASDWSIEFGEQLARSTGGRFTRERDEIPEVMDIAGRGCSCIYRIGLEPRASDETRVLRVKIAVGDEDWLPPSYRVLQLSNAERWLRDAGAVLLDPESAKSVALSASILPVSTTTRRWDVKLQVAVDPRTLESFPSGGRREARWEVGAVLVRHGGGASAEMLGVSRVSCPQDGCATKVVHERVIEGLRPGRYELRAFVRDRWTDAYGGALAELELPRPARPSTVGPLLVAAGGSYISADLPLRRKKPVASESIGARSSAGVHPLADDDEPVAVLSWICRKKRSAGRPDTTRRLSFQGERVSGFEDVGITRVGHCWAVRDEVDATRLAPGRYDYELLWGDPAGLAETPLLASVQVAGVEPFAPVEVASIAEAPAVTAPVPENSRASSPSDPLPRVPVETPKPPELRPATVELPVLLAALGEEARTYRDTALRFTCDETIVGHRRGRRRTLEFEYIYAHDAEGLLRDHRLSRRGAGKSGSAEASRTPVDLADAGLPAFVLRAYSSIFIFELDHQHLYDFEVLGEEVLGRAAVELRFEPVPPAVEDQNDWFGAAWVDRETLQLLRIRGSKAEDHETKQMFDRSIPGPTPVHRRFHYFDVIDVEFDVEKEGLRFPSRVLLQRTAFESSFDAAYLRTPGREVFRIVQSYDNYRIFGVRTAESADRVAE